jgi:hypothetical protein
MEKWGIALVAVLVGGVITHLLAAQRDWRKTRRDRLADFANTLGTAELLGAMLAFARDRGDEGSIEELRWKLRENMWPLIVYSEVQRFHTEQLREQ